MYHCYRAACTCMRVGITVAWLSVSSPSCMAYGCICVKVFSQRIIFQFSYLAFFFVHFQTLVQKRYPGTVVPPVLEPFQPLQHYRVSLPPAGITNYSTHDYSYLDCNITIFN